MESISLLRDSHTVEHFYLQLRSIVFKVHIKKELGGRWRLRYKMRRLARALLAGRGKRREVGHRRPIWSVIFFSSFFRMCVCIFKGPAGKAVIKILLCTVNSREGRNR